MRNASKITLVTTLALVGLFLSFAYITPQNMSVSAQWTFPSGYDPHGGYVDQITWHVYPSTDIAQAIAALRAGIVYAYDDRLFHQNVPELVADPAITVSSEPGAIYRQFTMQCQRFPTNHSGYRLALAQALDKNAVVTEARGGYAVPMDNPIPLIYDFWSYEPEMASHFYDSDIAAANASLDAAGFIDTPDSPHPGWRYFDADDSGTWTAGDLRGDTAAPNGCAIELWASAGYDPAIQAVTQQVADMAECGLTGTVVEVQFDALIAGLQTGEYSLGCFSWNINPPGDPDLLNDMFKSDASDNLFFYRFNNTQYDANVTAMMNEPDRLIARGYAWNCCSILMEEMPMIVCYNDEYTSAYRTDVWEGHVNTLGMGHLGNSRNSYIQVHLTDAAGGPYGCYPTEWVSVLSEGLPTTNVLMSTSGYLDTVMSLIYDSLVQPDPRDADQGWAPQLAWNWTEEDTLPAGDIQLGKKYTFEIYPNATWHDGTDVTADDVKYTLDTIMPLSPEYFDQVWNIYRIDMPDGASGNTVEVYSNSTGFIEFGRIANGVYILPKHIWQPHYNFTTWVPETPLDLTGSGPYMWGSRIPRQFVVQYRNPDWYFGIEMPEDRPLCPAPFNPWIFVGIAVVVIVIIIIAGVYFFRIRK